MRPWSSSLPAYSNSPHAQARTVTTGTLCSRTFGEQQQLLVGLVVTVSVLSWHNVSPTCLPASCSLHVRRQAHAHSTLHASLLPASALPIIQALVPAWHESRMRPNLAGV